ncbi:galactokinase [Tenacibaculum sp. 190524A02b]|uniref:galactokinase n=1 Tax=Tenacibaculum vairaonense TaxID=3137860 RepID=UPI0031FAEB56
MNQKLRNSVQQAFVDKFEQEPILVFSPGRINLIGEHTDYNEGYVFPAAIDKGIYLAIQKSTSVSCIKALDKEETYVFDTNSIKPSGKGGWENYLLGVVSEMQKKGKQIPNFNVIFSGDIPDGAGLSSSAALENSMAFGLNTIFDLGFTKKELILISQLAEHNYVGVKCGIMDQYASMFGEEGKAIHLDCRSLEGVSYPINLNQFELLLINTNVKHSLSDSAYNDRRKVCEKVANLLEVSALRDVVEKDLISLKETITNEEYAKALYVLEENQRTIQATESLVDNDIKTLGNLLFASHKGLSEKYKVSCPELDFLVAKAKASTAVVGARMMGGGFGGCTINIIETQKKEVFIKEIKQEYQKKFNHNCSIYEVKLSNGTQKI